MATDRPAKGLAWRRLAWFVGIWAAGVGTVFLVGWVLRRAIGL